MKKTKMVFSRLEKKYLLSNDQYESLINITNQYMVADEFGSTVISNIYFDTPTFLLIRRSLDKPIYKEKLRLRCYGKVSSTSTSFIEVKKKYKGVVSKRRFSLSLKEAEEYLIHHKPLKGTSQISNEIDWFINYYKYLAPKMFISYKRTVLLGKNDPELRITFDENIIWRDYDLHLEKGVYGNPLLKDKEKLMEIKIQGAMPLWLTKALDELKIYPTSFSKYGNAYTELLKKEINYKQEAN